MVSNKIMKIARMSLLLFLVMFSSTSVYAGKFNTTITTIRSWGGTNYTFQTAATNSCGQNWWRFDVETDKGYAVLVNLAFTTGKTITIVDKDCAKGGNYAQIHELRVFSGAIVP